MPFGEWYDAYYDRIFCPAIKAAKLTPCRSDDIFRPSAIINDVWKYTNNAEVLLADLTGKNPNVLYELGLAHAIKKPVVIISESMEYVPFDLRPLRIIIYDRRYPEWGAVLKSNIINSLNEIRKSPRDAILPAFLKSHRKLARTASSDKHQIKHLMSEVEVLRREVLRSRELSVKVNGPKEAEELIARLLSEGMPPDMILHRMSQLGVPTYWTERILSTRLKHKY